MMRPLFVEFPEDPSVWTVDTQYMLGRNLMVVPVFNEDGWVEYYLPKGRWFGLIDEKFRDGPGWVREQHDFMSLPVLVREGAVVVMGKGLRAFEGGQATREGPGNTKRGAVYDYTEDITVMVNSSEDGKMEVEVEIPDSSRPGEVAAKVRVQWKAVAGGPLVEVVAGELKGGWRIKLLDDGVEAVIELDAGTGRVY